MVLVKWFCFRFTFYKNKTSVSIRFLGDTVFESTVTVSVLKTLFSFDYTNLS